MFSNLRYFVVLYGLSSETRVVGVGVVHTGETCGMEGEGVVAGSGAVNGWCVCVCVCVWTVDGGGRGLILVVFAFPLPL